MTINSVTIDEIWQALADVKDPEIPVVSVVEMGIVRDVELSAAGVVVTMTPTFSGCPALDVMQRDIEARVRRMGVPAVTVKIALHPPWSSEWITAAAREKLRQFGIAPPPRHSGNLITLDSLDVIAFAEATCPRCATTDTILKNSFGATLCRTSWYCNNCQDAFDQFKPL